jgi:hypothetical protein
VRYSVQEGPTGGFVIAPSGQPPLPVIFASPREAQDYADALSAQDGADPPATSAEAETACPCAPFPHGRHTRADR